MARLDHLAIPVADYAASRDWYVGVLGLAVEFDAPDRRIAAVRDERDVTIFLSEGQAPANPEAFVFYVSVPDVHAFYRSRRDAGVAFGHEPRSTYWGYGAELKDPTGYRIAVWDEQSMPKQG